MELQRELADTVRLCEWNQRHLPPLPCRRALPFEALDCAQHEGHPYHPCFKSRTGFSVEDHARFGPETGAAAELWWLAVRRDCLRQNLELDEDAFWTSQLGPEQYRVLQARLLDLNAGPEHYGLLPVHPWQWQTLQRSDAQSALLERRLLDLGPGTQRYQVTQSVRTLCNIDDERAHYVKLPLSIRITSALRVLAPECVLAAPTVSAWLHGLLAEDEYYRVQSELIVLRECAAACFHDDASDGLQLGVPPGQLLAPQLGVVFRERLQAKLTHGQAAAPLNALTTLEPDERPFVEPWLRRYGVEVWVRQLIEVCVLPVWRLLVHHGVAVEAHAQNAILVHEQGWPTALALRDFHESLEYVAGFLAAPSRLPNWREVHPNFARGALDQHYEMSCVEALRELLMDTLFVFNLAELSHLLETHYQFSEQAFWATVTDCLRGYEQSRWATPSRSAKLRSWEPFVRAESLFSRRLRGRADSEWHHWVPNPLVNASKELPC
jgi:siderophore synthetase component